EVREIKPMDQWQMRKARTINGKEVFEIQAAPNHPVPVKTRHVLGFTYGLFGILGVIAGAVGVAFRFRRVIHSSAQRPTLIIGEKCFELVVRDQFVRIHIPYKNIREVGLITSESTGRATSIGVNLHDLNDAEMRYENAARRKSWTGWDYAIGNKEIFAVPMA